jgi:hypothetical protein
MTIAMRGMGEGHRVGYSRDYTTINLKTKRKNNRGSATVAAVVAAAAAAKGESKGEGNGGEGECEKWWQGQKQGPLF